MTGDGMGFREAGLTGRWAKVILDHICGREGTYCMDPNLLAERIVEKIVENNFHLQVQKSNGFE